MERYFFPEESTPDLIIQIIHHHSYLQTHMDQDANEFHMTGFKPVNSVISFFLMTEKYKTLQIVFLIKTKLVTIDFGSVFVRTMK